MGTQTAQQRRHRPRKDQDKVVDRGHDQDGPLSYEPPRIIASESLEAAAATCSPPAGGYGKSMPVPCGILGS